METESIYKVTMIDGPQTSIMPIKAYDEEHAVRIAANMGLGLPLYICRADGSAGHIPPATIRQLAASPAQD